MRDIDTAVVDSLKVLDPKWLIRERTWELLSRLESSIYFATECSKVDWFSK